MVRMHYPETLAEALDICGSSKVIPLAGGTDLMVRYENWTSLPARFPDAVLAVQHLEELKYIREEEGFLCIGGALPMSDILAYPGLPRCLYQGVDEIAAPALRNLATLAGNIQNASPAADSLPPLILMNAKVRLLSSKGARDVLLQDFVTGPGRTLKEDGELIESVRIPLDFRDKEADGRLVYRKVGTRKANALSKLSVCFWAMAREGRVEDIRLSFGAVAPVILRLQDQEKLLMDKDAAGLRLVWKSVRKAYEEAIQPIDDQRSTAFYRKRSALRLADSFIRETAASLA